MSTSTERTNNDPPTALSIRNRKPVLLLVCIVGVIVLLGGSVLWLLWGVGDAPGNLAQAGSKATASPTWMPTEVTPPAQALFYDTFVDNSHGWSLASNDGYFRILVNGTLILADINPDTILTESVPTTSTNLDDYVASMDFRTNQGDTNDGSGLYLRGDGSLDHDYRIDINGNNTVDVAKEWLDANQMAQTTMLAPPEHTSYLKPPGKQNTLTALLIGSTITVEINGFVVETVQDSSYTSGQIALFVRHGNSSGGVTVSFTRVEIDRLASPTPTPFAGQS